MGIPASSRGTELPLSLSWDRSLLRVGLGEGPCGGRAMHGVFGDSTKLAHPNCLRGGTGAVPSAAVPKTSLEVLSWLLLLSEASALESGSRAAVCVLAVEAKRAKAHF